MPPFSLTPPAAARMDKIQVLVLHGNAAIGSLIRDIVQTLGIRQVFCVEEVSQAVSIMRELQVHLMILEWQLSMRAPGQSGIVQLLKGSEFVQQLRQSRVCPNPLVPVLMLASNVTKREALQARDCGVNGIILKPLEAGQMCSCMREVIERPRSFIEASNYQGALPPHAVCSR